MFSIVEGESFKLCFASTFASHPRPPSLRSFPTPLVPRFRARRILFGPCLTSVHPAHKLLRIKNIAFEDYSFLCNSDP